MAIKKTFCLCMITFTIALHEITIFAQIKSAYFYNEIEKPLNLFASNSSFVFRTDTSETMFFSFEEGRELAYNRKYVITEDSKTSTVYVCENNNIELSTPDFGQDAIYAWKGPAGFSSLSRQIRLDKIEPFQAGFYNFTIKKNGSTIIGKIKLMVKEKPKAIAIGGQFCFGEPVILKAVDAEIGVTLRWTLPPTDFTSNTPETTVENLTVGSYIYFLSVAKNGCKSIDTAKVEVKHIPAPISNNAKSIVRQMAKLEANETSNQVPYNWKEPYLNTINDKIPNLVGLNICAYKYVLKEIKNGCSSMNISKVEGQKDGTIMYHPNSWTR